MMPGNAWVRKRQGQETAEYYFLALRKPSLEGQLVEKASATEFG